MDSLQDLKKRIDDALVLQKSQSMDFVATDSMLKGKKTVIGQAELAIAELNKKLASLEDDFKAKNKEKFDSLDKRTREVEAKELEVQKTLEDARLQRNIAAQEAAYSLNEGRAAKTIQDQLNIKFARVKAEAQNLLEIIG